MTNSKTVLTTATAVKLTLGEDGKYHLDEALKVQNLKVKLIALLKQPNKDGLVKIYVQVMQRSINWLRSIFQICQQPANRPAYGCLG